eukprot:814680-Rhodomonas_salina.2
MRLLVATRAWHVRRLAAGSGRCRSYCCPTAAYSCSTAAYCCPTVAYCCPTAAYCCPTAAYCCPTAAHRAVASWGARAGPLKGRRKPGQANDCTCGKPSA